MQEFVEKFIQEKQAAQEKACAPVVAEQAEDARRAREERLIRLGMCEREYTDSTVYSPEYPYQDYKTGRFYRQVAFSVTDEEYALICRYDDAPVSYRASHPVDRVLGGGERRYRVRAVWMLLSGVVLSILLGVVAYLTEGLLLALPLAIGGLCLSFLQATLLHTVGELSARVAYLTVQVARGGTPGSLAAQDENKEV